MNGCDTVKKSSTSVTMEMHFQGDCSMALNVYESAFGARVIEKQCGPRGLVCYSIIKIGDTAIKMMDDYGCIWPQRFPKPSKHEARLTLDVDDMDKTVAKARAAGLRSKWGPEEEWWGGRTAVMSDPFGHRWTFISHNDKRLSHKEFNEARRKWLRDLGH